MRSSLFNMKVNNTISKKKYRSKYKTPKRLYIYVPTPSTTSNSDTDMEDYDEDQPSVFCKDIVSRNLLESY